MLTAGASGMGAADIVLKPEFEHMRWLVPHIVHRATTVNTQAESDEDQENQPPVTPSEPSAEVAETPALPLSLDTPASSMPSQARKRGKRPWAKSGDEEPDQVGYRKPMRYSLFYIPQNIAESESNH